MINVWEKEIWGEGEEQRKRQQRAQFRTATKKFVLLSYQSQIRCKLQSFPPASGSNQLKHCYLCIEMLNNQWTTGVSMAFVKIIWNRYQESHNGQIRTQIKILNVWHTIPDFRWNRPGQQIIICDSNKVRNRERKSERDSFNRNPNVSKDLTY